MKADSPLSQPGSAEPGLTVRVRFKLGEEIAARRLAAKLIERVHELANLPESECDVDVDVEWNASEGSATAYSPVTPAPDPQSDL